MSKFYLSNNFNNFLKALSNDDEFIKLQYYMRCLKKAPHGGVFYNTHQSIFLKYYPIQNYAFLPKGNPLPYPVELYKNTIKRLIDEYNITAEELLVFCFCVDKEDNNPVFNEQYEGDKVYSAMSSGVLTFKKPQNGQFETMVFAAIDGKIKFTDCFNFDFSRLLEVFILWCVKLNIVSFSKIEDVISLENLVNDCDKYGLSNITSAEFDRQGFTIDRQYFLYNIFFDTSIGGVTTNVPKTIEIILNYSDDNNL